MNNHRHQMLYQKKDFSHHKICQLNNILQCCKCKKNNNIIENNKDTFQLCLFCGTPNSINSIQQKMNFKS